MTNPKLYLLIVSAVFFLVALLHLIRLINGWPVVVSSWTISLWMSWFGLVAAALLSCWGVILARKR